MDGHATNAYVFLHSGTTYLEAARRSIAETRQMRETRVGYDLFSRHPRVED